jgi:uncharacterized YccA/Bax inhibitor family protein
MNSTSDSKALRSHNPVFKPKYFQGSAISDPATQMTVQGTALKTLLLLGFVVAAAVFSWYLVLAGYSSVILPLMLGSSIAALVVAIVTVFKPVWSPFLASAYALLQGLVLGAFSLFFESVYPGIVIQAVLLTFGVLFLMLTVYVTGLVKVTPTFRMGVMLATLGIALAYFATFILSLFGVRVPYIHESGWVGIVFSLVVVGVAALNLLLDFDFIDRASESGALKYMEWFGAFGLMVTLIWLYLEILRLLGKLRSR